MAMIFGVWHVPCPASLNEDSNICEKCRCVLASLIYYLHPHSFINSHIYYIYICLCPHLLTHKKFINSLIIYQCLTHLSLFCSLCEFYFIFSLQRERERERERESKEKKQQWKVYLLGCTKV